LRISGLVSARLNDTKQSQPDRRLDSWKEIAAFFGRDERTVRRWEKDNALPIHRVPGSAKARVFAYESELKRWLSTPHAIATETTVELEASAPQDQTPAPVLPGPQVARKSFHVPRASAWAILLTVAAALAAGIVAYRKTHGFAVHASGGSRSNHADSSTAEAEDFYLKGRYYWNKRTPADLNQAVDYFTQAIVRDPHFADGYIGLADCYNLLREFSAMPPSEAYPRAFAAAQKAVELAPNSAEARTSLAFVEFWGFMRVADADRDFRRAIELDPGNTRAHHWYATFLAELNRGPEALPEIERARQLDPSSTPILADKGFVLSTMGQEEQAIALLKQIETAEPSFLSAHSYLSGIYFDVGQYKAYFEEASITARLQHDSQAVERLAAEQRAYERGGYPQLLQARLAENRKFYERGTGSDFELAMDYSLLNQKSEALRYLQAAAEKRDSGICTLLINKAANNLRQEPQFREILLQAGFPASGNSSQS
jgi:Tfp pilus assembly protein PilF